jgi:ligand-binding sensor domain-containing protein
MPRMIQAFSVFLVCLFLVFIFGQVEADSIKPSSKNVVTIQTTSEEGIWIGTSDGLSYVGPQKEYGAVRPPKKNWYVSGLALDENGALWIASSDGIYTSKLLTETFKPVVTSAVGSTITVDSDNVVWAGTVGQGIIKIIDEKPVAWYRTVDGLPSDHILTILSSNDKKIWAGTTEGLARSKGLAWEVIPAFNAHRVFSILEYSGKLFVGTDKGAYCTANMGTEWCRLQGTEGKVVTAMGGFQDEIIIGTKSNGILVFSVIDLSAEPICLSNKSLGLSESAVTSIASKDGTTILVGTFGGGIETVSSDKWRSLN